MNKVFSMIGLATRAGKTVAGEFSVEKAVKDNKAKVVIFQQKAQTIQKNYLKINASFIRFLYLFMVLRLS